MSNDFEDPRKSLKFFFPWGIPDDLAFTITPGESREGCCSFCLHRDVRESDIWLFPVADYTPRVFRRPDGQRIYTVCDCHTDLSLVAGLEEVADPGDFTGYARACPDCAPFIKQEDPEGLLTRVKQQEAVWRQGWTYTADHKRLISNAQIMAAIGAHARARAIHNGYWLHRAEGSLPGIDAGPFSEPLGKIGEGTSATPLPGKRRGRYSAAVELQFELSRLYRRKDVVYAMQATRAKMDEIAVRVLPPALEGAQPIYINPEITKLLSEAEHDYPDAPFQMTDLPCLEGFALFDGADNEVTIPIRHASKSSREEYPGRGIGLIDAVLWSTDPEGSSVVLAVFGRVRASKLPNIVDEQLLGVFVIREGETLQQASIAISKDSDIDMPRYLKYLLTKAASLWNFMGQRIVVRREEAIDRPTRRRLERDAPRQIPLVSIVEFRKKVYRPNPDDGYTLETEPHHVGVRYIVEAYRANHWYAKQGVHKRIWRAGSIRGPENAPLKNSSKIFAVTR